MKNFRQILVFFLLWRVTLFIIAIAATQLITKFGGSFPYSKDLAASGLPNWVWSFANFDGVYYLRIAQTGYQDQYSQAFFPLYSILVNFFTFDRLYLLTALILSNILFLCSLYLLYRLWMIDYPKRIVPAAIILLLSFPTSFYFGAVYSEALFLTLCLLSIILIRKRFFIAGGLLGGLAALTRIFGLLLIPLMLVEIYYLLKGKEVKVKSSIFLESIFGLFLIPLGTIAYMIYLKISFNNPWYFLSSQPAFGAQRSTEPFILLPQVFFRYFKILTTVHFNTLAYFNALLELLFTLIPLILLIIFFKKIRFSYWVFMMGCLILPTLTGTFSSMPRYILTSFLLFPVIVQVFNRYYYFILIGSITLAIILVSLYTRGYWVA